LKPNRSATTGAPQILGLAGGPMENGNAAG
jgi:hypothetical protein